MSDANKFNGQEIISQLQRELLEPKGVPFWGPPSARNGSIALLVADGEMLTQAMSDLEAKDSMEKVVQAKYS
eukprot:scaffold720_cov114-Cylindrotheca_fusiformis.AAC.18